MQSGADIVPVRRQCAVHRRALRALSSSDPNARRCRLAHLLRGAGRAERGDVLAEVRGASWAPNGARVIDVPSTRDAARRRPTATSRATAPRRHAARRRRPRRRSAPPPTTRQPRLPADPLLPHPRPSRGRPRSARPDPPGAASRARSRDLRLRRRRLGPPDPDLRHRSAWAKPRPCARSGPPAQDLLRQDRRRVHAHLRSRPEGVDPGAHRARREPHRLHPRRPPHDPGARRRGGGAGEAISASSSSAPSASASTAANR